MFSKAFRYPASFTPAEGRLGKVFIVGRADGALDNNFLQNHPLIFTTSRSVWRHPAMPANLYIVVWQSLRA